VLHVALHVHLRLLALGRRRQRDDTEDARADALGDRLDGAALAGAVAPLEDDEDLEPLGDHPFLQLDQLDVELGELPFVGPGSELLANGSRLLLSCLLLAHPDLLEQMPDMAPSVPS